MPRKSPKSELECLVDEKLSKSKSVLLGRPACARIKSDKSYKERNINYKNDLQRWSLVGKALDNTSDSTSEDRVGLVSNLNKRDFLESISIDHIVKKLSSNLIENNSSAHCDVIRVSEAQLFVEPKRQNNICDVFGDSVFGENGSFASRKTELKKCNKSMCYVKIKSDRDINVTSRNKKKPFQPRFKKFVRKSGGKVWKGLKCGWVVLRGSLRYLAGPLMTFDVSQGVVNVWKLTKNEE